MHRRIIILFSVFILFLQSVIIYGQFSEPIEKISEYNQKYPGEIVYVHTDREIYHPGDTIWFKVYLRNKATLKDEAISRTISAKIVDSRGVFIQETRLPVFNSESKGQIELARDTPEGLCQFICYSSWMKNDSVSEVFRKTIRIINEISSEEHYACNFDQTRYRAGDTVATMISFLDMYDKALPDVKIRYNFSIDGRSVEKGTYYPFSSEQLHLTVPDGEIGTASLKLSTTYKGNYRDTVLRLPILDHITVGFFPEGGNCIQDLSNRIAFKAYYGKDVAIEIKGEIHRENGDKLFDVATEHNGMGSFALIPEKGVRLYLKITEPANVEERYYLPETMEKGWVLNTDYKDQELTLTIKNNLDSIVPVLMTISVRDQLVYYKFGKIDRYSTFPLSTKEYPAGVAVVTLFDQEMIPRAEKLVFINQELVNQVTLETDYSSYLPRDSVKLKIKVRDAENKPISGSYSLAVVDDELCMSPSIDEPNIVSSLWLSPELKGRIVNPGYYFSQSSPAHSRHLDLLLLTQGWRRYRYQKILDQEIDSLPDTHYFDIISGEVWKRRYGRNSIPTKGAVKVYAGGNVTRIETDENGRFQFLHHYNPLQNPNITIFGEDKSGRSNVEVFLDKDGFEDRLETFVRKHMDRLIVEGNPGADSQKDFEDQMALGLNTIWLDELVVVGKKQTGMNFRELGFINARGAQQVDIDEATDLFDVLRNMGLPVEEFYGDTTEEIYYYGHPKGLVTWFVDDLIWPYQDVKYTRPEEIAALFVVKYPETLMFGMPIATIDDTEMTSKVLISIHIKPNSEISNFKSRFDVVVMEKFTLVREFYAPSYASEAEKYSQVPDLRKTIHWEPDVQLDEHGEATITYFNGDRYTRIKCILEGINDQGVPAYGDAAYKIQTSRENNVE